MRLYTTIYVTETRSLERAFLLLLLWPEPSDLPLEGERNDQEDKRKEEKGVYLSSEEEWQEICPYLSAVYVRTPTEDITRLGTLSVLLR